MAEVADSGFVLTRTDEGEIYYWRQIGGDSGGLDLTWTYPKSARSRSTPLSSDPSHSLEIPDD